MLGSARPAWVGVLRLGSDHTIRLWSTRSQVTAVLHLRDHFWDVAARLKLKGIEKEEALRYPLRQCLEYTRSTQIMGPVRLPISGVTVLLVDLFHRQLHHGGRSAMRR